MCLSGRKSTIWMYNYVHVHCTCKLIQIRSVLFCWYFLFGKQNIIDLNEIKWIELNWIENGKKMVVLFICSLITQCSMLTVLYSFILFWFFRFFNKILMWISELTWHGWRILYCCPALNQGTVFSSVPYY